MDTIFIQHPRFWYQSFTNKPIVMKSFATATDTQLISVFQKGDNAALEALIHRHKDAIFSTILFMVKDTHLAEDLFQEAFIKIIDTLRTNRYSEEGKFIHWALRVAHNLCVDHFRKVKYTFNVGSDEKDIFETIGEVGNYADNKLIQNQSYHKVRRMLDFLPDEQREVIVLRHFADMSFKEIAYITNTSINTALGRMRYALLNLRKLMTENEMVL